MKQNASMPKVVSDTDIINSIRNTLSSGWFSKGFQDVTFDVYNGEVNLKGSVDSLDDKIKVEQGVKKIDGVKQVNNQIGIVGTNAKGYTESQLKDSEKKYPQDYASSEQDRQLNAKIHDKLAAASFLKDSIR